MQYTYIAMGVYFDGDGGPAFMGFYQSGTLSVTLEAIRDLQMLIPTTINNSTAGNRAVGAVFLGATPLDLSDEEVAGMDWHRLPEPEPAPAAEAPVLEEQKSEEPPTGLPTT